MNTEKIAEVLENLHPDLLKAAGFVFNKLNLEKFIKKTRVGKEILEKEYENVLKDMDKTLHPYKEEFPSIKELPNKGLSRSKIIETIKSLQKRETPTWQNGHVSGAVYHGGKDHIQFLNEVYSLTSQTNPIHLDIWPSLAKQEAEIIAMTKSFLGGTTQDAICGTISSGGTESILLAMKAYRDQGYEKGIKNPEMIVPSTAHPAFTKASELFGIKKVEIPVNKQFKTIISHTKKAINKNTIALVGSAPSFPHGSIDPIRSLSDLAVKHKIGLHVDACLGGFILPFAPKKYNIPEFDFRLPGVTSISIDTHKFGYASKGSSVILYRNKELLHHQYFTVSDWCGGLYYSPTLVGSRPCASIAQCWAAMLSMGKQGYEKQVGKILSTAAYIIKEMQSIPEIELLSQPLFLIAFKSNEVGIYQIMEQMSKRHWSLNGLHKPACLHLCVTLSHTRANAAERFVKDLKESIAYLKKHPKEKTHTAPIYGMANTIPTKGLVNDLLKRYIDKVYNI